MIYHIPRFRQKSRTETEFVVWSSDFPSTARQVCEDWFENHVIVVSLRDRCFTLYVVGQESFVELANGPQPRSLD